MKTLSESNSNILAVIIDLLIPEDGDLPPASKVNVVEHIDNTISHSPSLMRLFVEGLRDMTNKGFIALKEREQVNLLKELESANKPFFTELIRHTYNGYYTNPLVIKALGMNGDPPQPYGHELEKGKNLKFLEVVKERGQIWRNPNIE